MQENNLKGLWISYEILTNEKLSDKEKYIYSPILFTKNNCALHFPSGHKARSVYYFLLFCYYIPLIVREIIMCYTFCFIIFDFRFESN